MNPTALEAKRRSAAVHNYSRDLQDSGKGPKRHIGTEPVCGFDLLKFVNEK